MHSTVTKVLRDEHADLWPRVEAIRVAADAVGVADDLLAQVSDAYDFLRTGLIVHAGAEDAALYPVVESFLGAGATATMSRDHVEVGALTAALGAARDRLATDGLDDELARELRRVLYGLYAVVALHFAKEEEVYLPILDDRLSADEAERMFDAMHAVAHPAAV